MSEKEEKGDDSDNAYLSLTKLTREQVGVVSWPEKERERAGADSMRMV